MRFRTFRLATKRSLRSIVSSMPSPYLRSSGRVLAAGLLTLASALTLAQTPPPADAPPPTEALRPPLSQVSQTLSGVNVQRWKAPSEVKNSAQQDMDSILRDLNYTLPPLLDKAAASPGSIAATFEVYRNIDALYDVLLRVAETATLSGSENDAVNLQNVLQNLQGARRDLGTSLMNLANSHDQELVKLRAAVATPPPPVKPVTPAKTVIDDGPPASSGTRHKKPAKPSTATPPQ